MYLSLRLVPAAATLAIVTLSASAAGAQILRTAPGAALIQAPAASAAGPVRRLSMDDAVRLALEQNLGIKIQRIDPQIQDVGVAQARSFWAPSLSTTFSRNAQTQPATSVLSGGATSVENGIFSSGVDVAQLLPWGGRYTADFGGSRYTTTNLFSNFSPQLQSAITLNYTQPLLRNFTIDQVRQQVQLSGKIRDYSDTQLQGVIALTTRNVKNAYWDLSYARNNLAAQRQSLELAVRSLHDNERRVEVGALAPIDIVQTQAEVAINEQNVIVADALIKQYEDRLRALIFDPDQTDFWELTIEPTDAAPFEVPAVDVDGAIRHALDRRADLAQAKNSIEQSNINIKYFKNQLLPDVSASVNYISTGVGGIQLSSVDPFALANGGPIPTRTIVADRGLGSVLGDVAQSSYPNWTVGVTIGYPLGSSTAQTNLARARLQYQQAQTQVKNLRLQIVTQVRDAARQVQTNQQRVKSARASRELQERKLEAEEKKQAAGMSTNFYVIQAQRDLAQARTQEIQAVNDFNKSMVDLEAVQEVPLMTTGGQVITTAGTGAVQAGIGAIVRQ
jgi:outer membrane protein TolC